MLQDRHPADVAVVIIVIRALRGWDQSQLAAAARVSPSSISRYEKGETIPMPKTFERILAVGGIPPSRVESLFTWIRSARAAVNGSSKGRDAFLETACGEVLEGMAEVLRTAASLILGDEAGRPGVPLQSNSPPCEKTREQAPVLWGVLKRRRASERQVLVEDAREFRNWALCELVCAESEKTAADDADRAIELAELAVLIADRVPGEEAWRWRVQGYAGAHLGNARRVRSDWKGAEEAFALARELWEAGAPGDPGLLAEAQVLSLMASLRIDQDRLLEAEALLARALAFNPGAMLTSTLLIKRARLLEWSGDYEGALETLRRVSPGPSGQKDPRWQWILRLNPALLLCHLGRYAEAEALLPETRALTARLANELDTLRLYWLEGRIAAGLGRRAEALEALSRVRAGFAARGIAYDAALATLEVAVLHLEQGHTWEVKTLARQMGPIFKTQGVHREALAALGLFCQAAEKEAVTVELARRLVAFLYRAQHDPELRFEASE